MGIVYTWCLLEFPDCILTVYECKSQKTPFFQLDGALRRREQVLQHPGPPGLTEDHWLPLPHRQDRLMQPHPPARLGHINHPPNNICIDYLDWKPQLALLSHFLSQGSQMGSQPLICVTNATFKWSGLSGQQGPLLPWVLGDQGVTNRFLDRESLSLDFVGLEANQDRPVPAYARCGPPAPPGHLSDTQSSGQTLHINTSLSTRPLSDLGVHACLRGTARVHPW